MGWESAVERNVRWLCSLCRAGHRWGCDPGSLDPSPPPPGSSRFTRIGRPQGLSRLSATPTPNLLGCRIPASGCGRARGCRGAWGGGGRAGRKGRGAPQTPAGRREPTKSLGTARSLTLPAMWGLLLAVTAFAPSVGLGLGAPSTSVPGLAPGSTLAPQSSVAQPSTKANGELWVPWSAAGQVRPTPPAGSSSLPCEPGQAQPCAMAADSAAPFWPNLVSSLRKGPAGCWLPQLQPAFFTNEEIEARVWKGEETPD